MSEPNRAPIAAVLLAGGRGRRLGGEDKASLLLRGRTLLQHWLTALRSEGILEIVVVGPDELRPLCDAEGDTKLVRENPPFGGPAAAVYAGMKALEAMQGRVLLLAVDVVDPAPLLRWLIEEARSSPADAVVPIDVNGREQPLSCAVAVPALRAQLLPPSAEDVNGGRVSQLLKEIPRSQPHMPEHLGHDVDSPDDAARLGVQRP